MALRGRNIQRRRQIIDHRVQQRLHAFILEGRTAQHREQLESNRALAQRSAEFVGADGLAFQKFVQYFVVVFRDRLDQLGVESFSFLFQFGGNFFYFVLGAQGFIAPVNGFHADQVDRRL